MAQLVSTGSCITTEMHQYEMIAVWYLSTGLLENSWAFILAVGSKRVSGARRHLHMVERRDTPSPVVNGIRCQLEYPSQALMAWLVLTVQATDTATKECMAFTYSTKTQLLCHPTRAAPTFHHGHWILHFRPQYVWSKYCSQVLDTHLVNAGVSLNFIKEPWKVPTEKSKEEGIHK